MTSAFIDSLWRWHDDTKGLLCFVKKEKFEREVRELVDKDCHHTPAKEKSPHDPNQRPYGLRPRIGLLLGPILFFIMLIMPTPQGMSAEGQRMAAIALLMATWWLCESIPIPATSLLPLFLFPVLGIMHTKSAAAPFASHLIFLFMGGFIIALSMQRWNLHRRIAMTIVRIIGFSPARLVFGFMFATALLSAFVSNTATTVMMMPIGLAVIAHTVAEGRKEGLDADIDFSPEHFAFGLNLMLGIAYAASIGGIATLIGTPPNTVLASFLSGTYNYEITFARWLLVGVPLAAVFLPICWWYLVRVANPIKLKKIPGGKDLVQKELREMGGMKAGERWSMIVFTLTALAWIFRPKLNFLFPDPSFITDATIAMAGALALFLIPVDIRKGIFVMNWEWAAKMPWGVLILFGGGLALAEGFKTTGLAVWIGSQVGLLENAPVFLMIVVIAILIIFLTELTSNTATAAMMMPILSAIAIGLGQNPLLLAVPAALAASCAFMLPVATPPNAIIFGSGYVTIPQMARTGFGLNLIGVVLVTLVTYILLIPIFGIEIGVLPAWLKP